MAIQTITPDPGQIPYLPNPKPVADDLTIRFDYSAYLAGISPAPTISTSTWVYVGCAAAASFSDTNASGVTATTIDSGVEGVRAKVTNTATLSTGEIKTRSCYVRIEGR